MNIKQYDTYLFDLDGTLTNTTQIWVDGFRDTLTSLGVTGLSDMTIAQYTHDWNSLSGLGLSKSTIKDFADAVKQRVSEPLQSAPMHEGAIDMLTLLRAAGKKTALVTSVNRPIFESIMQGHPLVSLMDAMVVGGDVPHYKPHPAGIHHALGLLSVPLTEYEKAVYIGDKDTDILAAQNAGIDGVLFFPPEHQGLYDHAALVALQPKAIIASWHDFRL